MEYWDRVVGPRGVGWLPGPSSAVTMAIVGERHQAGDMSFTLLLGRGEPILFRPLTGRRDATEAQ
ncbi:hypothetical protein Val02_09950 [Virgisporangium aliadipatigenens]|uniref:Uncharacterized protein n=1 Tax=Virgisporangium aliadipatigenens TaxID=741659 RepID=A0A8J4DN80_9ACTN|nr:hypothetical protein [Virgisporangium aliadipatigenens]GIJ44109.1 hypothetical protein Val02_09950 [Virgisporangium aliadipatigenens]